MQTFLNAKRGMPSGLDFISRLVPRCKSPAWDKVMNDPPPRDPRLLPPVRVENGNRVWGAWVLPCIVRVKKSSHPKILSSWRAFLQPSIAAKSLTRASTERADRVAGGAPPLPLVCFRAERPRSHTTVVAMVNDGVRRNRSRSGVAFTHIGMFCIGRWEAQIAERSPQRLNRYFIPNLVSEDSPLSGMAADCISVVTCSVPSILKDTGKVRAVRCPASDGWI